MKRIRNIAGAGFQNGEEDYGKFKETWNIESEKSFD